MINIIKPVLAAVSNDSNGSINYSNVYSSNLPNDPLSTQFTSLGDVVGTLLPYIYVVAGLILLLMLIWGGIGLMTSAGDPDSSKAAIGKIKGGLIGFLLIFISYFVAKMVELALGVKFM